ncbi:MAG: tRNA adenosine deaminase, partial [Actinobacteria bacterium]|nr:tRNA adenosine deaminase [Actinomycetota bacterium]
MPEFDDDLAEDIEEFDVLEEVSGLTNKVTGITDEFDIAVAAWHEDGRWTLGLLPDPTDIA